MVEKLVIFRSFRQGWPLRRVSISWRVRCRVITTVVLAAHTPPLHNPSKPLHRYRKIRLFWRQPRLINQWRCQFFRWKEGKQVYIYCDFSFLVFLHYLSVCSIITTYFKMWIEESIWNCRIFDIFAGFAGKKLLIMNLEANEIIFKLVFML